MTEQMQLQAFMQYDPITQNPVGHKACFVGPHPVYPDKMTSVSPYGAYLHETIPCDPTPEEAIERANRHLASKG